MAFGSRTIILSSTISVGHTDIVRFIKINRFRWTENTERMEETANKANILPKVHG